MEGRDSVDGICAECVPVTVFVLSLRFDLQICYRGCYMFTLLKNWQGKETEFCFLSLKRRETVQLLHIRDIKVSCRQLDP